MTERAWAVEPEGFHPNSSSPPFLLNSGWKCSKCDMRENLWLNMTDGAILCGRRYFDGSGGNNHAVEHYRETGYPLAVKLGTITPDGAGKKKGAAGRGRNPHAGWLWALMRRIREDFQVPGWRCLCYDLESLAYHEPFPL